MEYCMRLHENDKLFRQSVQYTAQQKGIKEIYIEKDYWVTVALQTIFSSAAAAYAVFKGGTALSKCYGIIERFSEDIDMVVLNEGQSGNQLKERLRKLSKSIELVLPEIEIKGLTNKRGMIRKTAHSYAKKFGGDYGQIRDVVILESSWLGYHEPFVEKEISSFIYEMMLGAGQQEMAKDYEMLPFPVRVLSPKRTICEKVMSLVRFSHSGQVIRDLRLKIRHLYDLHQLLLLDDLAKFLNSPDFEPMLIRVAQDDLIGYKSKNEWLAEHPSQAILFKEPDQIWAQLRETYLTTFSDMVFGSLPAEDEVLKTIKGIANRLQGIAWPIEPNMDAK